MTVLSKIRQYGVKNSFKRALKLLLRFLGLRFENYIMYSQQINNCEAIEPVINSNYQIRRLNYTDYHNSKGLEFDELKLNLFEARLKDKLYEAYGVFDENSLIYSSWISINPMEDSLVTLGEKLDHNEGLLLDIITHPKYRKQGLHNYMNLYCLKRIKEIGKSKAVVLVLKENIPARKSQERSGFKSTKMITHFNFLGQSIIRRNGNKNI